MTLMGRPGRVWGWGERPLTERACRSRPSRGRTQGCASVAGENCFDALPTRKKQQFLKFSTTNRSALVAGGENSLRLLTSCWRNTTRAPSHQQGELYFSTSTGIRPHPFTGKLAIPRSAQVTPRSFSVQILSCRRREEGFC